jgi:hypothetical protein
MDKRTISDILGTIICVATTTFAAYWMMAL